MHTNVLERSAIFDTLPILDTIKLVMFAMLDKPVLFFTQSLCEWCHADTKERQIRAERHDGAREEIIRDIWNTTSDLWPCNEAWKAFDISEGLQADQTMLQEIFLSSFN